MDSTWLTQVNYLWDITVKDRTKIYIVSNEEGYEVFKLRKVLGWKIVGRQRKYKGIYEIN